jgi:hypothetical protein
MVFAQFGVWCLVKENTVLPLKQTQVYSKLDSFLTMRRSVDAVDCQFATEIMSGSR